MKLLNDLAGRKFGKLSPIEICGRNASKKTLWRCLCECGQEATVTRNALMNGRAVSCGCVWRANISKGNPKHGLWGTSTYNSWANMIQRCTNPNKADYKNYGARGIQVCERWSFFENFLADMGECPPGLSIDRINNDGNYDPTNCHWATPKGQANNSRRWKREDS